MAKKKPQSKPHKALIIADPWDTLEHKTETTLVLAKHALSKNIALDWALPQDIYILNNELYVHSPRALNNTADALLPPADDSPMSSYQSTHWRCDPPVTLGTMRLWSLLAATTTKDFRFMNAPSALLTWNEKYGVLKYPKWTLPTLVTDSPQIRSLHAKQTAGPARMLVYKPAGDAASRGVALLTPEAAARAGLSTSSTIEEDSWPVLQRFQPRIMQGETRAFIISGRVIASLKKTPRIGEPVMRWQREEERPVVTEAALSRVQKQRAQKIAKDLAKDGVLFATIDFIGPDLLEINVTSPGLIHALGAKSKTKLLNAYWAAALK